jgi:hypothetical protein
MPAPLFELGAVQVPLAASLGLQQSYEPLGGYTLLRLMSGAAVKQQHWLKLRTNISADGWIPDALQALDYSASMTLKCVAPRAVVSASNTIVLPAARRSDAAPFGFAVMADGSLRDTPGSLAADTLTLAVVSGAIRYVAHYYPQLTVFAEPPSTRFDVAGASAGWVLTAEEA